MKDLRIYYIDTQILYFLSKNLYKEGKQALNLRELQEKKERETLSEYALLSQNSKGREKYQEQDEIRTVFQRDRDRIIHCKSFRRLKHKTQVFLSPEGDHYRTRLTHTLEVSQVARTISRALRLNEDLTEAIALGHDLGHTPFGHAGERALNEVCPLGFEHDKNSVRVAQFLEKGFEGLNLTKEVLNGFANHTWEGKPDTLEGQIVRYADVIAYINHDIDDAIRGGILEDIPTEFKKALGETHSRRITVMIKDIIQNSTDKPFISMSEEILQATLELKKFMFSNVYFGSAAKKEEGKAEELVKQLYLYYVKNPDRLPIFYQKIIEKEGVQRAVLDYVSSMSDHYAINEFTKIYVPSTWTLK